MATDILGAVESALSRIEIAGVQAAYLFGSHAEGRAHAESDVDVGILCDRAVYPGASERFEAGLRISGFLQAELRTSRVDLVVLNDAPPGLGRAIVTRGQRLFCADREADRIFARDVQLRAADLEPFLRRACQRKLESLAR